MQNIEERIIEVVKANPGLRKKNIDWRIGVSKWDIIDLLYEMVDEGKLRIEHHNDWGNMEHYEEYYPAEG